MTSKKIKTGMVAGGTIIFTLAAFTLVYRVNAWFENNHFVFHAPVEVNVKLFAPVKIEHRIISPLGSASPSASLLPVVYAMTPENKTPAQVIASSKYAAAIDHIWFRESTRGMNEKDPTALSVYCKNEGKTNELGYGGVSNHWCYKSFQEVVDHVTHWLDVAPGKNMKEKLCYYNTGYITDDCDYVSDFAE